MSVAFVPELVGRPFIWRTVNYGDIAVHVEKFSPNGAVAVLRIVGGEDSTPAHRYPELSDGWGFAVAGQLFKRQRGTRVNNTVRDVPGVGAVAVVTTEKFNIPPVVDLESLSAMDVRKYARQYYSTIAKLTRRADIIAAIRAQEAKQTEVTF